MNLGKILSEMTKRNEEQRAAQKIVRLLNGFTFRQSVEVLEIAKKVLAEAKVNSLEVGEERSGG